MLVEGTNSSDQLNRAIRTVAIQETKHDGGEGSLRSGEGQRKMRTGGAADGCQWQGVAQLGYEQSSRARRPCHGRPCLPRFRYYLDNRELPCYLLEHNLLIHEATLVSDLKNTTTLSLIRQLDGYLAAYDGFCELKQVSHLLLAYWCIRGNNYPDL